MIDLYITKLKNLTELTDYNIDILLNKTLSIYYDDNLIDMYPHKKKSLCIALFFTDIDKIILSKLQKKKKVDPDKLISEYFYQQKLPIFIDELLKLYRKKHILNIDDIKKNNRCDDLFLLIKYNNNNNYSDKLLHMIIEDKINLIKKIISEIIII